MAQPRMTHFQRYGQFCVLSVDDDVVNLMVVEQLLSPEGWRIISAQDGEDALGAIAEEATYPDFVFLDYQMNVGDSGDEICRKMRQVFGSTPIPIVMCTAMTAGSAALEACKQAGATDYLLKPYERSRMISKIEQYCLDKVRASKPFDGGPLPDTAPAPPMPAPQPMPPPAPALPPAPAPAASFPAPAPTTPFPAPAAHHAPTSAPSAAQPSAPALASASSQHGNSGLMSFFANLDLEYCGQKLADAGITIEQLRSMDDMALRRAGIVVKSQREKILSALCV